MQAPRLEKSYTWASKRTMSVCLIGTLSVDPQCCYRRETYTRMVRFLFPQEEPADQSSPCTTKVSAPKHNFTVKLSKSKPNRGIKPIPVHANIQNITPIAWDDIFIQPTLYVGTQNIIQLTKACQKHVHKPTVIACLPPLPKISHNCYGRSRPYTLP